jgi:hypothetical protein
MVLPKCATYIDQVASLSYGDRHVVAETLLDVWGTGLVSSLHDSDDGRRSLSRGDGLDCVRAQGAGHCTTMGVRPSVCRAVHPYLHRYAALRSERLN